MHDFIVHNFSFSCLNDIQMKEVVLVRGFSPDNELSNWFAIHYRMLAHVKKLTINVGHDRFL